MVDNVDDFRKQKDTVTVRTIVSGNAHRYQLTPW
jgi:hypothetical protein